MIVAGDTVSLIGGTATFANKNVGTGKTVTLAGATLTGADEGNYSARPRSRTTTANITPKPITGSFTAANKVYDGNSSATVLTSDPNGDVGGDAVSLTAARRRSTNKNVGTARW